MEEKKIRSAIESHNEYKADIAEAELIEIEEEIFKVRFEGNFCLSCCMDEYFLDLVHELKERGIKTEFKGFHQVGGRSFIAEYEKE
ncbi:MAG: hypothetical protein V5A66_03980 [Candidatus Thermoplasmatota archaeon]